MKKYLIALDLDGTLLYDWQTLKESTANYLKALKAEGHQLVIATGRPFRSSEAYYKQLELDTPLINYNGGLVSWPNNDTFEEIMYTIDRNIVLDVFKNNKQHIYNAFCEIKDDIFLLEKRDDIMQLIDFFNGGTLHEGPFEKTLKADPHGLIIVAHKNQGQHIEAYVNKHYHEHVRVRNWGDEHRFIIELYTPKTDKGKALKHVADVLGFKQDQVIAFGDGNNDIEMLEYAHVGVAMKNGHTELLRAADIVSPYRNTEGAIEKFLTDYLRKNT